MEGGKNPKRIPPLRKRERVQNQAGPTNQQPLPACRLSLEPGKNVSDVVFEIRKRLRIWAIKEPPRGGNPWTAKTQNHDYHIKVPLRPFMIA